MITSKMLKLNFTNDSKKIENELKALGIEPLRWAVVSVNDEFLLISVSYEC